MLLSRLLIRLLRRKMTASFEWPPLELKEGSLLSPSCSAILGCARTSISLMVFVANEDDDGDDDDDGEAEEDVEAAGNEEGTEEGGKVLVVEASFCMGVVMVGGTGSTEAETGSGSVLITVCMIVG